MGFCCCFAVLLQAYTMMFTCTASANILIFTNIAERRNYRNLNNLKKETKEQNGFFFNFGQAAY